MTKTIYEISANITMIVDGDHGQVFDEMDRRLLAGELKEQFGVDDVQIKSVKTFVTEEKGE